jgi:cobalt-zinc-cadmium efflux system membrane fusion protein
VAANGEVTYDQTRVARLSSRVQGPVWRVDKVVGQAVKKGDVLALVDAAEVGQARGELLQALGKASFHDQNVERLRAGYQRGAVPDALFRQAESARQEARVRLLAAEQALANLGLVVRADDLKGLAPEALRLRVRTLGLPADVAKIVLDSKEASANLVPLLAPLDGTVVAREVVAGEVVDNARVLFVVADTRRMWLTLHVRVEDARRVALGQPVRFRPDGGGPEAAGQVAWVSTGVDPKTRTVKVRADLDNAGGKMRDSLFGSGRVILRHEEHAVVVPSEAVQWEGDCHVVFVRDKDYLAEGAPKVFHTRTVRPGARDGGNTEIIAGVLPGEVVVTRGSSVLRSELLKNNLGEG